MRDITQISGNLIQLDNPQWIRTSFRDAGMLSIATETAIHPSGMTNVQKIFPTVHFLILATPEMKTMMSICPLIALAF
jgi:hypothetical protein